MMLLYLLAVLADQPFVVACNPLCLALCCLCSGAGERTALAMFVVAVRGLSGFLPAAGAGLCFSHCPASILLSAVRVGQETKVSLGLLEQRKVNRVFKP